MDIQSLFDDELRQRGFQFSIDAESGRHVVELHNGQKLFVCLSNLERELAKDGDLGRISRFADSVLSSTNASNLNLSRDQLYWCLEPTDYIDRAEYRVSISERADRVLVHLSPGQRHITWVNAEMLSSLNLTEEEAGAIAFENLGKALSESSVEAIDIDGVQLGFLATSLPFKSSLTLAPNLEKIAGEKLGWPLLAVFPDRDFLYMWAAQHTGFVQRVGTVVLNEYAKAAYSISTEVFEISDEGIHAVGDFRRNSND